MKHIKVIGSGNPYRRDNGAGPAVIYGLRRLHLSKLDLAECDGEPTRLLDLWTGAELAVVVDAVRTDTAVTALVAEIAEEVTWRASRR